MQYNQNSVDTPSVFYKHLDAKVPEFCASDLISLFNACFAEPSDIAENAKTYLVAHASEPIYLPYSAQASAYFVEANGKSTNGTGNASNKLQWLGAQALSSLPRGNKIFFNRDYFASALHEVAHWCIAGAARRLQVDYGYWYAPDGRDPQQQLAFESVEVKPQAIEWAFSLACNKPFRISNDNLSLTNVDSTGFENAVKQQLLFYIEHGFPPRAQEFIVVLRGHYGVAEFSSLNILVTQASE